MTSSRPAPSRLALILAAALAIAPLTGAPAGAATPAPAAHSLVQTSTTAPLKTAVPTISGTAAVGNTLTAKPGTWTSGTTFTYQWFANGTKISGATGVKLKLAQEQKDKRISVRVTGSLTGYKSASTTSAETGKTIVAATPKVSGTAVVGSTLTATPGTWTSSSTLTYQWYVGEDAIKGATKPTFKLTSAQKDKAVHVRVTGKKSGYATAVKKSAVSQLVQVAPTPTVTGSTKVASKLTAKAGTWSSGTKLTYQWYAGDTAISGATKATLTLGTGQAGKTVKVKVTGKKSGYPTVTRTSAATAKVTYPSKTAPKSDGSCPSWAPIKGNADSMIYHMPGQRHYDITKAEECFRTEDAAVKAGYRKSKV